jgi:hypothetical protein
MDAEGVLDYCKFLKDNLQCFYEDATDESTWAALLHENIIRPDSQDEISSWNATDFINGTFRIGKYGGYTAYTPNLERGKITVFGSDLRVVGSITHNNDYGKIRDFTVTPEDIIVVITQNGNVVTYDCRGLLINHAAIPLDEESMDTMIISVSFYDTGCFVIFSDNKVYHIQNYNTFDIEKFCTIDSAITCVAAEEGRTIEIIEGQTSTLAPTLWVYSADGTTDTILCCERDQVTPIVLPEGSVKSIDRIIFSPDSTLSALLIRESEEEPHYRIAIYMGDFTSHLASIDIGVTNVRDIIFCGTTILITSGGRNNQTLITVGAANKRLTWDLSNEYLISSEADGARILTHTGVHLIRVVPYDEGVYGFIAHPEKSAGMSLINAMNDRKKFATSNPFSNFSTNTNIIPGKPNLTTAIKECLEAAKFFFDIDVRKTLLEAVVKAKFMVDVFDQEDFSNAIKAIRLCTNLAQPPMNMPISEASLRDLSYDSLVIRLCNRYLHVYAKSVGDYLGNSDGITTHWAHCLIRSPIDDNLVIKKLKRLVENDYNKETSFDYVDLARFAFHLGKNNLGNLLLDLNQDKAKGVPFYLKNKNYERAISDAVESNDEALVIHVLKEIRAAGQDSFITECIASNEIAFSAYLMITSDVDPNLYLNSGRTMLATSLQLKSLREGVEAGRIQIDRNDTQAFIFAKEQKDSIGRYIIERYQNYVRKGNNPKKTPIQIVSENIDNARKTKSLSKAFALEDSDILWIKIDKYFKTRDENYLFSIFKSFELHDILTFTDVLFDEGIKDPKLKAQNEQLFEKMKAHMSSGNLNEFENHLDMLYNK